MAPAVVGPFSETTDLSVPAMPAGVADRQSETVT